jgi:hypothetical protein
MRKLASIQKILGIKPIEKADVIEVCVIQGWECVIKKSEGFKVGDLVVYIEVDSITPDKPEFEFLRERKFRVRTIKLRGQISQGLVLPISILPNKSYNEDDDVTDIIGVKKYDPQAEVEQKLIDQKLQNTNNKIHKFFSKYPWYRKMFFKPKKSSFPSFIKKTDEIRIQNMPYICKDGQDIIFSVTEKLDGQSGTFFLIRKPKLFGVFDRGFEFGVCSRNLHLPKEDSSSYWTIAKQYKIKSVLEKLMQDADFIILQGEILGNRIQGNKYKIDGYDFYAFNLKWSNRVAPSEQAKDILQPLGIKFVSILDSNFKIKSTVQEMVEYAKGNSVLLPILREGVVIRNYENNISFKVINPDFLLKNDD